MDNQHNPDLSLDSIFALSVKTFYLEILLYHLEEKFHFPTLFVNGCNFKSLSLAIAFSIPRSPF